MFGEDTLSAAGPTFRARAAERAAQVKEEPAQRAADTEQIDLPSWLRGAGAIF